MSNRCKLILDMILLSLVYLCESQCSIKCNSSSSLPQCPPLNTDVNYSDRCGPSYGGLRCNQHLASYAVYCNSYNGSCGNTSAHQTIQPNEDIYDFEPLSCDSSCDKVNIPKAETDEHISCNQHVVGNISYWKHTYNFSLSYSSTDITFSLCNSPDVFSSRIRLYDSSKHLHTCQIIYDETTQYIFFDFQSNNDTCQTCQCPNTNNLKINLSGVAAGDYYIEMYRIYSSVASSAFRLDMLCTHSIIPAPTSSPIYTLEQYFEENPIVNKWIDTGFRYRKDSYCYSSSNKAISGHPLYQWPGPVGYYNNSIYILKAARVTNSHRYDYYDYDASYFTYHIDQIQIGNYFDYNTLLNMLFSSEYITKSNYGDSLLSAHQKISFVASGDLHLSSQQMTQYGNKLYIIQNYYPCSFLYPRIDYPSMFPDIYKCNPYTGKTNISHDLVRFSVRIASVDLMNVGISIQGQLTSLKFHQFVPNIPSANRLCLTSNETHLFIISHKIWIYHVTKAENQTHNTVIDVDPLLLYETKHRLINNSDFLMGVACTISNDHKYLYLFGGDTQSQFDYPPDKYIPYPHIFKYDIFDDILYDISSNDWIEAKQWSRAITAPNDLIYLYGSITNLQLNTSNKCPDYMYPENQNEAMDEASILHDPIKGNYSAVKNPKNYQIFNTKTDKFLSDEYTTQEYEYTFANGVVYNDEILVRISRNKDLYFFMEFLITVDVYFDFTLLQQTIYPTMFHTGIPLSSESYIFHEYTFPRQTYQFLFYSTNLISTQMEVILQIKDTQCIVCTINMTNCEACINGIPIPPIGIEDSNITEIVIKFKPIGDIWYLKDATDYIIKPESKELIFPLATRCVVDFSPMQNMLIVPGEKIGIINKYKIQNCLNNNYGNRSNVLLEFDIISAYLVLNTHVAFEQETGNCKLIYDKNNGEGGCLNGLYPTISTNRKIFELSISTTNDYARPVPFTISVLLADCGFGKGIIFNSSVISCQTCQINQIKINTILGECFNCVDNIKGVNCAGSSLLKIKPNYWVYAINKNGDIISLSQITNQDSIYSAFCAPNYCCQDVNSCNYLNDNFEVNNNLCANGRSVESILCGQCKDGMYELMGTSECGYCSRSHFGYLTIIFIFSMIFTLSIFFMDGVTNFNMKPYKMDEINWKRIFIKDENTAFRIMFFRVMLYYFQMLSQILSANGITHVLMPIMSIFADFSIDFSNKSHGFCIIGKLNALDEIIYSLIPIYFILFHSVWISLAIVYFRKRKQQIQSKSEIIKTD
eukprot:368254_1